MEIDIETGAAVLTVVSRKHGTFTGLVDVEDWPRVSQHRWHLNARNLADGRPYFQGSIDRKTVPLHRFITSAPAGMEVDHRDNTRTLDNRRSNLRIATTAQNQANRRKQRNATGSRYKGVCAERVNGKLVGFRVFIRGRNGREEIGRFKVHEELQAACAYDRAAREHWGEFARTNFPDHHLACLLTA